MINKNIFCYFKNLSVKIQIIISTLIISLIFISSLLYISYDSFTSYTTRVALENSEMYMKLLNEGLKNTSITLEKNAKLISTNNETSKALTQKDAHYLQNRLIPAISNENTDILRVLDKNGKIIAGKNNKRNGQSFLSLNSLILKSMQESKEITSYEVIEKNDLTKENILFAEKIKLKRKPTEGSKKGFITKADEEDALSIVEIVPVKNNVNEVIGAVLTAKILNKDISLIDKLKGTMGGVDFTIFKDDLRIATTVTKQDGKRAIGTLLGKKITDKVLINGENFEGEAMVLGKPYQANYIPIFNNDKKPIGVLFAAVSENYLINIIKYELLSKIFITLTIMDSVTTFV